MAITAETSFKTLIVDDSPRDAEVLKRNLIKHFSLLDLELVEDLQEMKELLSVRKFDIIFLDNYFADREGIDYIPLIRKLNPNAYVIAISQDESIGLALRMLDAGASDFLTKGDIFSASGRFYSTINRAIVDANGKQQIMKMFQTMLMEAQIFLAWFEVNAKKGIEMKYFDGPTNLKNDVLEFGVRSLTALQDSPKTIANLPFRKTNYDAIIYVIGREMGSGDVRIKGAYLLFYPRAIEPLLPKNSELGQSFENLNIQDKEAILSLKAKFLGIDNPVL